MITERICPGAAEVTDVSIRKRLGDLVPTTSSGREVSMAHWHVKDLRAKGRSLEDTLPPSFHQPGHPQPAHRWDRRAGISQQMKKTDETERKAVPSSDEQHLPAWGPVG